MQITDPPAELDYEMWLGPAPWAPYFEGRCHFNFRWLLDYSGGHITDWGCHLNDIAQWANGTDETGPVEVVGRGEFPTSGLYDTPTKFEIEYTYADGVKLICRDGRPGIEFDGERGRIHIDYGDARMRCTPARLEYEVIKPEGTHLYTAASEHRNFLDCVKTRRPCYYPAEVGHRTASLCHLGVIAVWTGRKLRWDPVAERIMGDPDSNRYLARANRSPWVV
jgi:predicted dehydrogenase